MAIPIILGGIAIGSALLGAGKHYSAKENRDKAKDIYNNSNSKQNRVGQLLENELNKTKKISEDLGLLKLNIQKNEVARFVFLYEQLNKINNTGITQEKIEFYISKEEINEMKKISMTASEVLGAGIGSLASGVLSGAGIYSSVMTFGVAGTGTAIGTLSGVAATNATLAWLGGGTLAAGGGGMALGTTVLGGLVAGPAILVSGLFADNQAEKALTEAKQFEADVDIACGKMESQTSKFKVIQTRCGEFEYVLTELCKRLNPQLDSLEKIVSQLVESKNTASDEQISTIHLTAGLAKTVKNVLALSILDKQDSLTFESKNVQRFLAG